MEILARLKEKCNHCKGAKYINTLYSPTQSTVEYVCPVCKGTGFVYVKRWITTESIK